MESIDYTIHLLRDPYRFISRYLDERNKDIACIRLFLKPTIIMKGEEASNFFYRQNYFSRKNAAPKWLKKTLFGEGGVQGLVGLQHTRRKRMIMSGLNEKSIDEIERIFRRNWLSQVPQWENSHQIRLLDELQHLLTRTVCEWAGVPLTLPEVEDKTQQLTLMITGAAPVSFQHLKARVARKQAEVWIADLVGKIRNGSIEVSHDRILNKFSMYEDEQLGLLPPKIVAVEILNILRPTVAVAWYMLFIAHALHKYPAWTDNFEDNQTLFSQNFIQEIRRFYPFFPFVAARAKKDLQWKDQNIKASSRVLLDLYGTNHDSKTWPNPMKFDPERFKTQRVSDYNLIPQGGANVYINHRCAGEKLTLALMHEFLIQYLQLDFQLPQQNLEINWSSLPARPYSPFVMSAVRMRHKVTPDTYGFRQVY